MKILNEFREFAVKGNVVDLAIAVIIGAAFGRIITSLVNDIVMPPIGYLLGGIDFSNLFINLGAAEYASLAEAQSAGAPTINYGLFLNTVINFLIVAWVLFLVIRTLNDLRRSKEETPAKEPEAPPRPHSEVLLEEIRDLLKRRGE